MENTVKLSKYWRDIKFIGDTSDYEEIGEGIDYENEPHSIAEAILEVGSAEPSCNGLTPSYYIRDADHNLDGTITTRTIHIDGTNEQLAAIRKGVK